MLERRVKGSYTVEAVFVFPVLIFLIAALLYLGFDLHDRVCLASILESSGREAAQESAFETIKEQIQQEANKKLCITSINHISVEKHLLKIEISYEIKKKVGIPQIFGLIKEKEVKRQKYILIYNPMEIVRGLEGQ